MTPSTTICKIIPVVKLRLAPKYESLVSHHRPMVRRGFRFAETETQFNAGPVDPTCTLLDNYTTELTTYFSLVV